MRPADVRTQSPSRDGCGFVRAGRGNEHLAHGMRGGDILLFRSGRKAHFGGGSFRGNEALYRLFGSVGKLFRR